MHGEEQAMTDLVWMATFYVLGTLTGRIVAQPLAWLLARVFCMFGHHGAVQSRALFIWCPEKICLRCWKTWPSQGGED